MVDLNNNIKYMSRIIGNSELCQRICLDIINNTLSHAYIFEGADGTGKYTMAMNIAAAISCEGLSEGKSTLPCGECKRCRKIFGELTPDITVVTCEDGKASISKDQIKAVREKACFLPNEMKKKVIIIRNAHLMTTEAQNALLLTLEEPPEYILFLLLTNNSSGLLETVRSRAPIMRIRPLKDQEVSEYLVKTVESAAALQRSDPKCFAEIIKKAAGSIGTALKLTDPSQKEEFAEIRRLTDDIIDTLRSGRRGLPEFLNICENTIFKSREGTNELLQSTITALRDLLLLRRADAVRLCYYTEIEAAEELSCEFSISSLIGYMDNIENTRLAVTERNANIKLSLIKLAVECFGSAVKQIKDNERYNIE